MQISPVNIHWNYAYYFERDRYNWSLEICEPLTEKNKGLPAGHKLRWEDVSDGSLPRPQTGFHQKNTAALTTTALTSYCIAANYTMDERPKECKEKDLKVLVKESYPMFIYDLQKYGPDRSIKTTPCIGATEKDCIDHLDLHYREYAREYSEHGRRMDWSVLEKVESMAEPMPHRKCPSFG